MAKIKKIQEAGRTIYPATILQGIKDAESGKALGEVMARKTGNYPELTAGFAENIVGDGSSSAEVISFRPTAGENRNTLNEGAARITKLKGNSVVCNQLVNPSIMYPSTSNGIEFTVSNGKVIANGTTTAAVGFGVRWNSTQGHIYAMVGCPSGGSESTYKFYNQATVADYGNGVIYTESRSGAIYNVIQIKSGVTANNLTFTPRIYDLTKMFGAGNEPTTVEQFYSMLPKVEDINAYNEGKIMDGHYGAIKTTALNQWEEQWERGQISSSSGKVVEGDNKIISKNFIPALPNTSYFLTLPLPQDDSHGAFYYDINKQYIGYQHMGTGSNKNQFTTPSNCAFIKFDSWGTTYNNDICLNLSWPEYTSLNGTYQPYKTFERDLSWVAKYFPNGMRSAGNVADEIRFNSTTQKWEAVVRVGVVDLGSLDWTYRADYSVFRVLSFPAKAISTNIKSSVNYDDKNGYYLGFAVTNNTVYASITSNNLFAYFPDYTDPVAFKAAMAGVMLNYELATPIVTEIEENVNFDFDVSDYGTEELLVAEGAQSAPLAADIVYAPNALSTIKNVPDIFTRLAALEAALASLTSAATTNVEE